MKILIIGNGLHTSKRILPALSSIDNVNLIEIIDRKKTSIEKFGNTVIKNFNHIDKNSFYDFVIIASTPNAHLENFEQVKSYSDIFLIEKPLSNSSKIFEYKKFLKGHSTKRILEGLMYMHHPLWEKVQKVYNSNKLERIQANFTIPHIDRNNFRYQQDKGGGFTYDLGIYPLSLFFGLYKEDYVIDNFTKTTQNNFDIDLGGKIEITTKSGIKFNSKWGISDAYSNELILETNQDSYYFPFIFSKPDGYQSFFEISSNDEIKRNEVGTYNQFTLMYKNIMKNNLNEFSTLNDQEKTYNLLFDLMKK